MNIEDIAKSAKEASILLNSMSAEKKNEALLKIKENLEKNKELLFEANKKDIESAKNIEEAVLNRLKLTENKMNSMLEGILDVVGLDDPNKKTEWKKELDKGLILTKISCPIGVIGVIFEARPDVMVQIASLAIKSSNAVILKGGSESNNLNTLVLEIIHNALKQIEGFPKEAVSLLYSHDDIKELLSLDKYINLIIPRGSNKLVKYIMENTKIPVLGHASGICHIYVDEFADFDKAIKIIVDSKTQYPAACNSVETLLINKNFKQKKELLQNIENSGIKIIKNPENWSTEYGDKILSYKETADLDEAISHINKYSSGHTDCIITENKENAEKFLDKVDSAGVYHNVSTRFADGFRYGFGAEVGISTNKIHARGPVGLEGLMTYKYLLEGNGDIVEDYALSRKKFHHKFI